MKPMHQQSLYASGEPTMYYGGSPSLVHLEAYDTAYLSSANELMESVKSDLTYGCRRRYRDLRHMIRQHCEQEQATGVNIRHLNTSSYVKGYKRAFDLLVATSMLLATLPLWLIIAIAIKLDSPGPVLFMQSRTGYLGRRFRMFKFRTMVIDAEQRKKHLMSENLHGTNSPDFKIKSDPRVTRVGRFLRKTSLDELPNLISVLKGDMSIVGPRPTSFEASTYETKHLYRLAAKPGITGIWQVSGRANVDFDQRVKLDVHYINNISLTLDFRLLLLTLTKVTDGAY